MREAWSKLARYNSVSWWTRHLNVCNHVHEWTQKFNAQRSSDDPPSPPRCTSAHARVCWCSQHKHKQTHKTHHMHTQTLTYIHSRAHSLLDQVPGMVRCLCGRGHLWWLCSRAKAVREVRHHQGGSACCCQEGVSLSSEHPMPVQLPCKALVA